MARLPDIDARRPTPRASVPIVSDQSGAIIADAVTDVGRNLQQFGQVRQERQDRFSYAQAKSHYLNADVSVRKELENDPDWRTYEERYREKMGEALNGAADFLTNDEDRALFEMEYELMLERGAGDMRQVSRNREVDWGRGDLSQRLEDVRESSLNTLDLATRAELESTAMDLIDAALEREYINEQEAQQQRQSWKESYAEGFVALQHPDKRIALLENPEGTPAQFLRTDDRARMLETARDEAKAVRIRRESQVTVDAIMNMRDNRAEALRDARTIEDPELRDSVVSRVNQRFDERERLKNEDIERRFNDAATVVEQSGSTDGIHRGDWLKFSIPERNALEQRASQISRGVAPTTDIERYVEITDWIDRDPYAFAKEWNPLTDRYRLDEGDFKRFVAIRSEILGEAESTEEWDGFRTENQIVNETLPTNLNDTDRNRVRREVDDRVRMLERQTGKDATRDEIQAITDELVMEVIRDDPFWDTKIRRFEIEEGQFFYVKDVDQIPRADLDAIRAVLQAEGKSATDAAIVDRYNAALIAEGVSLGVNKL